jgi:glycosyltransferase involved in cell wall biosynthesis
MNIHVWVPDFAGATGGIQTFSRFLVRGLRDCYPSAKLRVFIKNDTSVPEAAYRSIATFQSVGTWPPWQRTAAFTWMLLTNAYRERPDLIVVAHVNFAPVAHWLQKLLGIPFIAVAHGVEIWQKPKRSIYLALRSATQLLAVSNFTRERMSDILGLPISRIALLPDTFDSDEFVPGCKPRFLLKRYGINLDFPVIFTLARLERSEQYKGYDKVVASLVDICRAFPSVRYILGGRGSDWERLVEVTTHLGLRQNVIFAGHIPEHELCAHYNLCDVFAMPSKGEGFGIVFLEALSCGKPVIAGNKDGSVDAVLNGRLGVLVDPDSVDEIANAITRVLSGQRTAGEGQRTEDRGQRSEVGGQTSEVGGQRAEGIGLAEGSGGIPEIVFEPERLRREVIEAYGYQRFKHRLAEVLKPLVPPCS